jgi:hypothetical protein
LKRKCFKLISSHDGKRAIYLDEENSEEILAYIRRDARHQNKFRDISNIILEGLRNPNLYDKEDIDSKSKRVTAMKFFKGQENDRIYCKEVHAGSGTHVVIAAILYEKKKTTKLTQKQKNIIQKVGGFIYEIQ